MFKFIVSVVLFLGCMLGARAVIAQEQHSVFFYYAAEWYDRFEGAARLAEVQKLQQDQWISIDTFYDLTNEQSGVHTMRTQKNHLEPYLDEEGYVVYWVPEVAPQFPGGKKALDLFTKDVIGSKVESVQASVFIRCTIDVDGTVKSVAEAQSHPEFIPRDVIDNCLDAVRYMPNWKPGMFRGKPVRVCRLITFSL